MNLNQSRLWLVLTVGGSCIKFVCYTWTAYGLMATHVITATKTTTQRERRTDIQPRVSILVLSLSMLWGNKNNLMQVWLASTGKELSGIQWMIIKDYDPMKYVYCQPAEITIWNLLFQDSTFPRHQVSNIS